MTSSTPVSHRLICWSDARETRSNQSVPFSASLSHSSFFRAVYPFQKRKTDSILICSASHKNIEEVLMRGDIFRVLACCDRIFLFRIPPAERIEAKKVSKEIFSFFLMEVISDLVYKDSVVFVINCLRYFRFPHRREETIL